MSEQAPPEEVAEFQPPKRRNVLLIILVAVLAISCLVCGVGAWFMQRPGKPIPPTAFIAENTSGLVVVRVDANEPKFRELLTYAATVAAEQGMKTGLDDWVDFFKSHRTEPVPKVTLVGSYQGSEPENLDRWTALILSELPGGIRWQVKGAYYKLLGEVKATDHEGAKIVAGEDVAAFLRSAAKEARKDNKQDEHQEEPEPALASEIENVFLTVFSNVCFVGETQEDVQAAVSAFNAPRPDAADEEAPAARPAFMDLYEKADPSAMLFGAASNANGILLAALFRDEADRQEARATFEQTLAMAPDQVKALAFSAALVTADEIAVKLWLEAANPDAARQVDAAVRSFVESQVNTTEELPLEAAIVESETSVADSVYQCSIKVTGLKKLVQAKVEKYYEGLRSRQPKEEVEPEEGAPPLPDEGGAAAPQPDDGGAAPDAPVKGGNEPAGEGP